MSRIPVVVIVDDDRVVADSLALILQKHGYEPLACYSADDAIELISEVAPDIIVSDVVMKDLTGIDVALAARKLLPQCKVILFSGNPATAAILESANQDGHQFTCLAKPVHPNELLAQIMTETNPGPEPS